MSYYYTPNYELPQQLEKQTSRITAALCGYSLGALREKEKRNTKRVSGNHVGENRGKIVDEVSFDGTANGRDEIVELFEVAEMVFNSHAGV